MSEHKMKNIGRIEGLIKSTLEALGKVCPACMASTDGPTWELLHRRNRPDGEPHPCRRPK